MPEIERLCPKTLGIEILNDNSIVACGAPCIEERCMSWGGLGKFSCHRKNKGGICKKAGSCFTKCKDWKENVGCKIIEKGIFP